MGKALQYSKKKYLDIPPMNNIRRPGLLLLALLLLSQPVVAEVQWLDNIIATVGTDIVTRSELQHEGFMIQKELQSRNTQLPPREEFINQVLERLIMKKIQLQKAVAIGIRIDDNTLNKAIENIAKENRLSLPAFRQALLSEGIDYKVYRKDIKEELTLQHLRQREIQQTIKVSDSEIDSFLQQQLGNEEGGKSYHLAHILISLPETANSEELQLANDEIENILAKHKAGTDFSSLAVAYSDGQQALKGGDIGWRNENQLPTIFSNDVKTMQQGDISKAIRSPSGLHLVKVLGIKKAAAPEVTQTHARHILIKGGAAKGQLSSIRQRILEGESFAKLAKEFSEDKGSATKGGDLGWASPGSFVPAFEQAMNRLNAQETSQPFQSTFGWHIVQVLERRTASMSEEDLKARARNFLFNQKTEEAERLWLRKIRDETYISIHQNS